MALAVRPGHHPVGCQVAVLPAGAIPRDLDRARRMAVVDATRVCRLAADIRSAVVDVLAAACAARSAQSGDQPAGLRCCGLRLSGAGRDRHHPVLPRPRLARRWRRGGGARLRAGRRRERAHPTYRPGGQPRVSATDPLAPRAGAGAGILACGNRSGRGRRAAGDRPRPGGAAVSLRARRLRADLVAHRGRHRRAATREPETFVRRGAERRRWWPPFRSS